MTAAEQARGRYVRLADQAAGFYAPAVHVLGLVTFLGWIPAGHGWEAALTAAIAVLIITCPCALALAVPAVQVAATSRLFAKGVLVKAPDGLERLAEIDTVVFDKTGTLTLGEPTLAASQHGSNDVLGARSIPRRRQSPPLCQCGRPGGRSRRPGHPARGQFAKCQASDSSVSARTGPSASALPLVWRRADPR